MRYLLALVLLLPMAAKAQISPGGGLTVGAPIQGSCTSGYVVYSNGGFVGCEALAGGGNVNSTGTPVSGQIALWTNSSTIQGTANATISAGALTLGASGTVGSLTMGNATSGTVKLQTATGALGTVTASFPANTGTVAETNLAQTFSAAQTFSSTLLFSGLSAGTQVSCLGLDSGNNVVLNAAACGGGGGSSAFSSLTSGTNTAAAMVVGTGASLAATGSGTIGATSAPLSGITGLGTGVGTALAAAANGTGGFGTVGASGAHVGLLNAANVWSAQQSASITALSISTATFTPDGSNNDYSFTMVHASCPCTLANPSATPVAGTHGVIIITQSATGSDTIGTWGSQYQAPGGTSTITLSTAANAVDVISYVVKDSTHILLVPSLNFSH